MLTASISGERRREEEEEEEEERGRIILHGLVLNHNCVHTKREEEEEEEEEDRGRWQRQIQINQPKINEAVRRQIGQKTNYWGDTDGSAT